MGNKRGEEERVKEKKKRRGGEESTKVGRGKVEKRGHSSFP